MNIFRTDKDQAETIGCHVQNISDTWCLRVISEGDSYTYSDSFVTCESYCLLGNIVYDDNEYKQCFENVDIAILINVHRSFFYYLK